MSILHDALTSLQPRDWSDVPQGSDLKPFLRESFSQAELIVNSVPPPPGGSEFANSTRKITSINAASSAADIHPSDARAPEPNIPDLEALHKGWGKPIKLNPRDNPLGMSLWKMAGHDRHGAWFARRSVHEGLGFAKWKKAMIREFPESLAMVGNPGEGSVRGIGADRRLEREVVDGVGKLEVYQLSAQFPGPVAPREFITCLLTTDSGLSDASAAPIGKNSKHIPRHFMVVSIPVDHPDAPPRQNLVRGHYESVEMIREIPLTPSKSRSVPNLSVTLDDPHDHTRSRGLTIGAAQPDSHSERIATDEAPDDPETNPIEWIMITRSDPGGGIPRFMVERNTPASIAADGAKFLNWACSQDEIKDDEEDLDKQEEAQEQANEHQRRESLEYNPLDANGHLAGIMPAGDRSLTGAFEPSRPGDTGIIASLTNAVQKGVDNYAPNVVHENLPEFMKGRGGDSSSDSDSDTDSFNSFTSATADFKTAAEGPRTPDPMDSTSSLSLLPDDSSGIVEGSDQRHYERELRKLEQKRRTLDEKMEKTREREGKKKEELNTKEEKEQDKIRERLEKDKKKQEGKHKREIEKLEQKREKEEKRIEAKRQKARDKDGLARTQRERDEYKRQLEILRRENELLRRQMGDLQRENTLLVQKVGKFGEGQSALKQLREELSGSGDSRKRSSSLGSRMSRKSAESTALGKSPLGGSEEVVGGSKG